MGRIGSALRASVLRPLLPVAAALGVALAGACAREVPPSGGPADRRPPVIVSVRPDTFARVEPGNRSIRIQFDEALAERPDRGTLDQAVQISPRTGEVEVRHKGDAIEVEIEGGLRAGVVYRVTVLPVIQDRFNNTMLDPFEWVFTTGPDFAPNVVAGEIWDRITGDPVGQIPVVAISPDSVRYTAMTDSSGVFVMRFLPTGVYALEAFDDLNRNDLPDPFEIQGVGEPLSVGATDTLLTSFWVMLPDTTPPQVTNGSRIDSTTLRLTFDDALDPEQSLVGVVRGIYRDSGDTPGVLEALHPWEYRMRMEAEAEADEEPGEPTDPPAVADTLVVRDPPTDTAVAQGAPPPARAPAARRDFLPDGQRVPEREMILLLRGPIEGGSLYTVVLGPLANVAGVVGEGSEGLFRLPPDPPRAAPDSTPPDTTGVVPDTTGAGSPTEGRSGPLRR